jgi:tetratricopeptide (TPR) repeat protein
MLDLQEVARKIQYSWEERDMESKDENERILKDLLKTETDIDKLRLVAESDSTLEYVAIPALERLLEINPNDARAIAFIGLCLFMSGEDDEAQEKLSIAKSIDPEEIGVLELEAFMSDNYEKSLEIYSKIFEIDPENVNALEHLTGPLPSRLIITGPLRDT